MNIRKRLEKIEALTPTEPPFRLVIFVPAKNGMPHGTERGIQRIHCGDLTLCRATDETEEQFISRARAEAERLPADVSGMKGVYARRFTAGYAEDEG